MRKLVYIGKNAQGVIVKTSSYEEMNRWKADGFTFTEQVEEIQPERHIDKEKIAARQAYIRNKRKRA